MWCGICNKDLIECACPDLKERLRAIAQSPHIMLRWCKKCDNHYALCKCEQPEWIVKTGN